MLAIKVYQKMSEWSSWSLHSRMSGKNSFLYRAMITPARNSRNLSRYVSVWRQLEIYSAIRDKAHTITKKTKQFGSRNQQAKSDIKGSNYTAKTWEEDAKNQDTQTTLSLPFPYMALYTT